MKYNINIITEMLSWEANHYRTLYDEAVKNRQAAVEKLNQNYVPNTPLYQKKAAGIEEEFNDRISQLRSEAIGRTMPDVEELRQQERERVRKIQTGSLLRLRDVSEIPMTASELAVIAEEVDAKNDYWAGRVVGEIAQKNGIPAAALGVEAPLDVKESVLNQLEEQLGRILEFYGARGLDTEEAKRAKNLYLNDDVLKHAQQIYSGNSSTLSPSEAAEKAHLTIRGQQSQTAAGIAAANALRNATPEMRNYLLYDLSKDESFSDTAASIGGCADEIADFRNGKAVEFEAAVAALESIKKSADKSEVADVLAQNRENGFLTQMYGEEIKRNGVLADLIAAPASDS